MMRIEEYCCSEQKEGMSMSLLFMLWIGRSLPCPTITMDFPLKFGGWARRRCGGER
jgi:hypothetical protein